MSDNIRPELPIFEDEDERKLSVLQESTNNPQLSPLIKDVVRKSVLHRRKTRGEPDIEVEFNKPRKYELTEEEKLKKERRTTQNREAARRCRLKKKQSGYSPEMEMNKEQAINAQLQNEVKGLKSEVDVLKSFLSQHQSSGGCNLNAHPPQQPEVPTHWSGQPPPAYDQCPSYPSTTPSPDSTSSTAANQLPMEETSYPDVNYFFQRHIETDTPQYSPAADPLMNAQLPINRQPLQQEARDWYQHGSDVNSWGNQNDDGNRVTPEIPRDDFTSFYSSRAIEQEQKPDYNEPIGIPSLDCIPFDQLLTGNTIDVGQYLSRTGSQH